MAELQSIIVFHGRHFVRHFEICNPIYVRCYSAQFKKNDLSISNRFPGVHKCGIHTDIQTHTDIHTDTQTHTHDDSIRRNAMRCISPKNGGC